MCNMMTARTKMSVGVFRAVVPLVVVFGFIICRGFGVIIVGCPWYDCLLCTLVGPSLLPQAFYGAMEFGGVIFGVVTPVTSL